MDLRKEVRDQFSKLFTENKEVERVYKRVASGVATYDEAQSFASEIGVILSKVLGDKIENVDEVALDVVDEILTKGNRLVSAVCDAVQLNLNDAAEVGLNTVVPKAELFSKRKRDALTALQDAESPEKVTLVFDNKQMSSLAMSTVDDYVKANADFQRKAGMSPVIVRVWDGTYGSHDTRRTDWCSDVAGTFKYDDNIDKRVFVRHKGCQCKVMYYPSKDAVGRITALEKGTKDVDQVLWNTGRVTSNSRQAVLRRRRKQFGKEEARKILNEEWRGGFNGNAERHF